MSKCKRLRDIGESFVNKLMRHKSIMPNLGTDPEFFVADAATGKILASDKFFPDKHKPLLVTPESATNSSKLFFDGIQAEINVPKNTCREVISGHIRSSLIKASTVIGDKNKIVVKPSVRVQKSVIAAADPEARIFGCMPDFNAYTRGTNTPNIDASTHPYRYAGGHIHVGISTPYIKEGDPEHTLAKTEEGHLKAIKFFDYMSGPILVLMDKSPESRRRRSLYGTAGCFRPTPYGIEYRTPSCWWLKSPSGMSLAFGMVRLAWNLLLCGLDEELKTAVGWTEEEVRGIVNESDVAKAKKFWNALRPYVAVAGMGCNNPLSFKSMRSSAGGYLEDDKSWYNAMKADKYPTLKGSSERGNGTIVHTLAAFEYMVRHGSDLLISDDIAKEWVFHDRNTYYSNNGLVNQMFEKLTKEVTPEIRKDFQDFQTSFLAVTI